VQRILRGHVEVAAHERAHRARQRLERAFAHRRYRMVALAVDLRSSARGASR
jgi:hypothetical protein